MWRTKAPEDTSDSTGDAVNAALHVFNQEGHSPWEDSCHLKKQKTSAENVIEVPCRLIITVKTQAGTRTT